MTSKDSAMSVVVLEMGCVCACYIYAGECLCYFKQTNFLISLKAGCVASAKGRPFLNCLLFISSVCYTLNTVFCLLVACL